MMKEPEYEYDLKLQDGKSKLWYGRTPQDAAARYEDTFPGSKVVAWRWPVVDVIVGMDHPRLREHPCW